jgi:short subunit dehydrogenase-like uncharacterized protein
MPDIVLFGATGYTGRLTAHALHRRGADFAIAGRNRERLDELAAATGGPDVFIADAADVDALTAAAKGGRVLLSCAGPFAEIGASAVEAAFRAGTHYVDSCAEIDFVARLVERGEAASATGITLAPALGFDEVPADVAATLSCEGLDRADVVVTYAAPISLSRGSLQSLPGVLAATGTRVSGGKLVPLVTGDRDRWSPLPPPLGVRRALSAPMVLGRLAPLHLDLRSLDLYVTMGNLQWAGAKLSLPLLRAVWPVRAVRTISGAILELLPEGPSSESRKAGWTILAEARSVGSWRNVTLTGTDLYGLTGELLAAAATIMAGPNFEKVGTLAPVQVLGLDTLQKLLIDQGVEIHHYEPA